MPQLPLFGAEKVSFIPMQIKFPLSASHLLWLSLRLYVSSFPRCMHPSIVVLKGLHTTALLRSGSAHTHRPVVGGLLISKILFWLLLRGETVPANDDQNPS